jgi:methylenetetrahydrofolate reductase (NADPH)
VVTRISELLAAGRCYSIEMFPPKTPEAEERLRRALVDFSELKPSFVSITYGAGGSTRTRTHSLVVELSRTLTPAAMAHLTCVCHSRDELREILERYRDAGVDNILALRGDLPAGVDTSYPGDLDHALDLVRLARETGPFCVAVAAHPEGHPDSPDLPTDRLHLAEKLAEADFAITQFFFRVEDYLEMVEAVRSLGVERPIIPGIMPITNLFSVARMAELSGAAVPTEVVKRVESVAGDPASVLQVGVEIACEMGRRLLDEGAPGLHIYSMNSSTATVAIFRNLGLASAGS